MTLLLEEKITEATFRREWAVPTSASISSIDTTDLACGSTAVVMADGTKYGYDGTSWNSWS